jgi:hypothetical protein
MMLMRILLIFAYDVVSRPHKRLSIHCAGSGGDARAYRHLEWLECIRASRTGCSDLRIV